MGRCRVGYEPHPASPFDQSNEPSTWRPPDPEELNPSRNWGNSTRRSETDPPPSGGCRPGEGRASAGVSQVGGTTAAVLDRVRAHLDELLEGSKDWSQGKQLTATQLHPMVVAEGPPSASPWQEVRGRVEAPSPRGL